MVCYASSVTQLDTYGPRCTHKYVDLLLVFFSLFFWLAISLGFSILLYPDDVIFFRFRMGVACLVAED